MLARDTISDMTLCKIACDGDDCLEITEAVHNDREGGHQLPSLCVYVAAEQRSGFWRRLEEAAVEKRRRPAGDRDDLDEACLDLVHLLRGHPSPPFASPLCMHPALGRHQLRLASIELPMIALAHAEIAGPGIEVRVEPLMPEPHLRVQERSSRHRSATGASTFLPVVHIVLLDGTGGAEPPHTGQPDRLLDLRRGGPVDIDPRPDLGLVGATRMPDAEGAGAYAKQGEIGEQGADDRADQSHSGSQALFHLRADLLLVREDLGHRRLGHVVWPDAHNGMAVSGGDDAPGG